MNPLADLVIKFSEAVIRSCCFIRIFVVTPLSQAQEIPVVSSSIKGSLSDTITVSLLQPLKDNTDYYVVVEANSFQDLSGNGFLGITAQNWAFKTADTTPPLVVAVTPAHLAVNQQPAVTMTMTFDEPVRAGTGNLLIRQLTTNTIVASVAASSLTQVRRSGRTCVGAVSAMRAGVLSVRRCDPLPFPSLPFRSRARPR